MCFFTAMSTLDLYNEYCDPVLLLACTRKSAPFDFLSNPIAFLSVRNTSPLPKESYPNDPLAIVTREPSRIYPTLATWFCDPSFDVVKVSAAPYLHVPPAKSAAPSLPVVDDEEDSVNSPAGSLVASQANTASTRAAGAKVISAPQRLFFVRIISIISAFMILYGIAR